MFSLVVLFTLFLGLVGVLVVFSEWQKKRAAARAGDAATNLLLLHNWLADHGCHAPTPEEAIHVLNKAACQRAKSEVPSVLREGEREAGSCSLQVGV